MFYVRKHIGGFKNVIWFITSIREILYQAYKTAQSFSNFFIDTYLKKKIVFIDWKKF